MTREKRLFTPALEKPPYNSKWWRRRAGGGVSPCIQGSPWYCRDGQSALANCVGWSWGRMAQLEDNEHCLIGCFPGNDYPGNAQNWVNASRQQGYTISDRPELGAVAVWRAKNNNYGHVANVEDVDFKNDKILCSESGYGSYYWRLSEYHISGYKPGYIFIGYILPKYEFVTELPPEGLKVGDKVKIIAPGAGSSYGDGKAYGVGWERYVYKIYDGRPYPYRVGFMNGETTGFYRREALERIDK